MAEHGLDRPLLNALRRVSKAEKLVTLLLTFILLTAAAAGVSAVLTGPDWASLWESLILGLLVGWGLAILRWPAWRSAMLALALGLLFCLLFAGGLNGKVTPIFQELFRLAGNLPVGLKTGSLDLSPLGGALQGLYTATGVVSGRVVTWVKDLASSQPVFDPVATRIVWGLVVWLVSAWAGWVVEAGHSALVAVLPALSLNLSTLSYGRSTSFTIYLLLGLTLVLIAVVQYDQRQQEWEGTRIAYPERKGREVGNTSLVITVGLVLIAALLSSLSLSRIEKWTSTLNRYSSAHESGLAKSLGIQQPTPTPDAFSIARAPGLPRNLLIGAGPELSKEEVMAVAVSDLTDLLQSGRLPPLYWRSFTYDIYTGHGWSTSPTLQSQYQPDQPIQPGQLPYHQLIHQTISPLPGQTGTVYAAGEAVTVDAASDAAWRSGNDLFGLQTGDNGYSVESLIPVVSVDTLRTARQDYPTWVTQRYLALPAEVPGRVKQLAIQLTATEPTPYDRARAIELYLQSTYPYTTDVPHPPTNRDLADYFLFDLRKGYCDYYASAMVVLSRAAGIPARLAVGYASGTYNLNSRRFIVTQAEAHSWVEVYFPGIGWVPFEPTAGRPAINRSTQPTPQVTPAATPIEKPASEGPVFPLGWIGYSLLGLIAIVVISLIIVDELYLRQMAPRQAAAEIFRRLQRYGRLLKVPAEAGQTPYEYGAALIAAIDQGASTLADRVNPEIEAIMHRIVRLSFRSSPTQGTALHQIVVQWKSLRWQLRRAWILYTWGRLLQALRARIAGRTNTSDGTVVPQE